MIKMGAITVGQSPRTDVTSDILPLLGSQIELIEAGALDDITDAELAAMEPLENEYILVSRLRDGRWAHFAKHHIIPLLQKTIDALNAQGVQAIMMLCTGEFPGLLHSPVPLIYPDRLLSGLAPAVTQSGKIAVLVPEKQQEEQARKRWSGIVELAFIESANPYAGIEEIESISMALEKLDVDLIVLDCIGYTVEMKEYLCRRTGKQVLLPRTIMARMMCELVSQHMNKQEPVFISGK